jgi:hypothetical protein
VWANNSFFARQSKTPRFVSIVKQIPKWLIRPLLGYTWQFGKFQYPGWHSLHLLPYAFSAQLHWPSVWRQKGSRDPNEWQLQAKDKKNILLKKYCFSFKLKNK